MAELNYAFSLIYPQKSLFGYLRRFVFYQHPRNSTFPHCHSANQRVVKRAVPELPPRLLFDFHLAGP